METGDLLPRKEEHIAVSVYCKIWHFYSHKQLLLICRCVYTHTHTNIIATAAGIPVLPIMVLPTIYVKANEY